MAGFDAAWLTLREPADRAARDRMLIQMAGDDLARHPAPMVCDLGAGTGSAFRAFDGRFPGGTRWVLVDDTPEVLAEARRQCGARVETRVADLTVDPAPWPAGCRLVTASALFDLAGAAWIDRFVAALVADGLPLLACLTYDGVMKFDPAHPADGAVTDGFNAHQATDKGLGGPALGPAAAAHLSAALEAHGYTVMTLPSPWVLDRAGQGELMAETLKGIAGAAIEIGAVSEAGGQAWLQDRQANLTRLTVGHWDLYATPPA